MQLRQHGTLLSSLAALALSSACVTETSLPPEPGLEPPRVEAERTADDFHSAEGCSDRALCGLVGYWDEPIQIAPNSGGDYPTRGALLATGEVIMWSNAVAYLFEPTTGAVETIPGPRDSAGRQIPMGGGAHAVLLDGRLLLVGEEAFIFDATGTRQFESVGDVPGGPRKGATATIMPDGTVVVVGGLDSQGAAQREVVLFDPYADEWKTLGSLKAELLSPFVRAISNNKLVIVDGTSIVLNLVDMSVTGLPPTQQSHVGGTAVLMPRSKANTVAVIGGGAPASPTVEIETLSIVAKKPTWAAGPPLSVGRYEPNTVILPDGSLLVVGGQGVREAEILRPDVTAEWHTMAAQQFERNEGSFAMLLPDGRVLAGGGGANGAPASGAYIELYSPPYLFDSPLPVLLDAPSVVHRGDGFHIEFELPESACEDEVGLVEVLLVGLGASADGFDSAQSSTSMALSLGWSKCAGGSGGPFGGVWVTVPTDPAELPLGSYMMFGVEENGIPSLGSFVRVED